RVTSIAVGGYRATVDALLVRLSPTRDAVDFTTYLRDRQTGRPVDGATVVVTARTPTGRLGPLRATARANTYEVLVPVKSSDSPKDCHCSAAGDWPSIRLHVSVRGPAGEASFAYSPPSLASDWLLEP